MTIALLRFPFLVQKVIFEEIDLLAVLSIAMLSKKSNATARACLRQHKYHLRYFENVSFQLVRKFSNEDGNTLVLALLDRSLVESPYQLWPIGYQEVPIESTSNESSGTILTLTKVYCDNTSDFAMETLQYLSRLLPKLSLTLKLKTQNVETFRRIMQSVRSVNELKEIDVGSFDNGSGPQDELVKLILDESHRAKNLFVYFQTSDNFVYPTSVPFSFDSVFMTTPGWISRDHFIRMFLSCKKVQLQWKDFDDEDLTAIFKAWTEGSSLEYLEFVGAGIFHQGKTLDNILEEFPGAVPVRIAEIPTGLSTGLHFVRFGEGKCYLIQRKNGQTKALVCIYHYSVILTTNFQIGNEVDVLAARIEEELHF
ncbi:hypothetical protein CAEBREN_22027 [Caenorhabditis brenneri]|uniref:F-box domain-containing protein n=1 Tax=Caenorhabditis brenneri TaxID=135651 RepID=G0NCS1_CAEBE|nr:hypothetical protein CAEBREN_22027 [Caenorhabditis brenneri]